MENETNEENTNEEMLSVPELDVESKIPEIDTESKVNEMLGIDEE